MNIYEAAKRAKVSIATVSRVINNSPSVRLETQARVRAVLEEMKYTPNAIARSLAVNSTQTIGVLASDVRDSYYAAAIYTLEQALQDLNYNVILCNTGGALDKKKRYLRVLLEKKVDGIILVGSVFKEKTGNTHILETAQRVPVVMLNSQVDGDNIYSVVCDDASATERMVDHMILAGRRRIAYVYDVESFSGLAKLEGYRRGMERHGCNPGGEAVIKTTAGLEGGLQAAQALLSAKAVCQGVLASEDELAAGLLKGLLKAGWAVPEDIAVFGYNNSITARLTTPELSSADNKAEALALQSAAVLSQVLQGQAAPKTSSVTPDLIFRTSCPAQIRADGAEITE